MPCNYKGRSWSYAAINQGIPKVVSKPLESRRRPEKLALRFQLKLQYFDHWLTGKDPDGKDWRKEKKEMTEDETVGWNHRFNGHESEQTPGDGEGQESLACCSPWRHKESDTTWQLNDRKAAEGSWPRYHFDLWLRASRSGDNNSSCSFRLPGLWYLVIAAVGK